MSNRLDPDQDLTVCKSYQQTKEVAASKGRVSMMISNSYFIIVY